MALSRRDGCQCNLDSSGARGCPSLQQLLPQMIGSLQALNQSCLQIYRRLQRSTSPHDIPLTVNREVQSMTPISLGGKRRNSHVFDIMSAANGNIRSCQFASTSFINANEPSLARNQGEEFSPKQLFKGSESWWSRLFPTRRRSGDISSFFVKEILKSSGQHLNRNSTRSEQSITGPPTGFPYTCVICDASFKTHKQLDEHKQRSCHFGCSICNKEFLDMDSLHDHCDMLSHWSDDEDGDDDDFRDTSSSSDGCFLSDDSDLSSDED